MLKRNVQIYIQAYRMYTPKHIIGSRETIVVSVLLNEISGQCHMPGTKSYTCVAFIVSCHEQICQYPLYRHGARAMSVWRATRDNCMCLDTCRCFLN